MASTQTERKNVATVARAFEAFAAGDFATLAATFHPDARWHVAPTGVLKGHYRGRDQILGFFAHLTHETGGTFRSVPVVIAAAGPRVFSQNVTFRHTQRRAVVLGRRLRLRVRRRRRDRRGAVRARPSGDRPFLALSANCQGELSGSSVVLHRSD